MIQGLKRNNNNISFTSGIKVQSDNFDILSSIAKCRLGNFVSENVDVVEKSLPGTVEYINSNPYIRPDTFNERIRGCLKDFCGIPLDILDYFTKKIPAIQNSTLLKRHHEAERVDDCKKGLQGFFENGQAILQDSRNDMLKQGYPKPICGVCYDKPYATCEDVSNKFDSMLNSSMKYRDSYDTKKERLLARIVSGFTAALFLGSDFYNKPILKGKSKEEAKKLQRKKQRQEIVENLLEGTACFVVASCFAKFSNRSALASALIAAGVSLVSRIVSRLATKSPIFRVDVPDEQNVKKSQNYSMEQFIESTNKTNELPEIEQNEEAKENKGHTLSLKNILMFCGVTIAAGFGLRFLKGHTKVGEALSELAKKHDDRLAKKFTHENILTKEQAHEFAESMKKCGLVPLANRIERIIKSAKGNCISLGKDYNTRKAFGLFEVNSKDLSDLKYAIPSFLKDLVSYPYKIAKRIVNTAGKKENGLAEMATDPYNIKNIYTRFKEFEKQYGKGTDKLYDEFKKYINKARISSFDDVKNSKIDNSKIAVIAQTMNTFVGMFFNMNDEFNASIKSGYTKEEAEKEARLRGINKFIRMSVQLIICGNLNKIFSKQYNNSMLGAGIIVAISTVLTDSVSRILSGMPLKKMTKEELEEYQENHKKGLMSGYYKFIDKLAS